MLKELKDIGEYVNTIKSPVESFITVPRGDFYIISLNFDWEKFVFESNIKEWDIKDLIWMCYKPWKWRVKPIFPNSYIGVDENWKFAQLKKDDLISVISKLKEDHKFFQNLEEKFRNTSIEEVENSQLIKQKIQDLPSKDQNKKPTTKIFTIKISKNLIKSYWLTPLRTEEFVYLGDIQEFQDIFVAKNKWEGSEIVSGFCHVCEKTKDNLIDFYKSKWVWFPYKFYNLDKPWFTYNLDPKNGYKSFGVCQECYDKIQSGYSYFKENLQKNILGEYCYIFPSIFFEKNNKVFEIIEKYDNKNLSSIESNIKDRINANATSSKGLDSMEPLFVYWESSDQKEISEEKFVKLNIIFGHIDPANSDRLQINYFLRDILPSRLGKYYKSNMFLLKRSNSYMDYMKKLLGEKNISWNLYEKMPELHLYPSYQKNENIWNLKNFFETEGIQEYYKFLDKYLHNKGYLSDDLFKIIYKKLYKDYVDKYLNSKDGNLFFSILQVYLVHIYFLENNLLDTKLQEMNTISFDTQNERLLNLQDYFNQFEIFNSYDKIYASLIGLYVKLLLEKQQNEIGSNPFITRINFEDLDYDGLLKLLNETRSKFNKYAEKKFNYYPSLYWLILQISMKGLDKNLSRDEIVYYFGIWMEILPKIYFQQEESKKEAQEEYNYI